MLYAPAVCNECNAVFASSLLIAEGHGEPSSYRRSAGPCPHCQGRGTIPEWVFRFHSTAATACDSATPAQLSSLTATLRHQLNPAQPMRETAVDPDLTADPSGPWRAIALELLRSSGDQRRARLTLLLWMLDRPTSPAPGHHLSTRGENGSGSPTAHSTNDTPTLAWPVVVTATNTTSQHGPPQPSPPFTGTAAPGDPDITTSWAPRAPQHPNVAGASRNADPNGQGPIQPDSSGVRGRGVQRPF
jgi:hypothetical protein